MLLSDVSLTYVAYIGPSREQRPRKTFTFTLTLRLIMEGDLNTDLKKCSEISGINSFCLVNFI